MQMQSLWMLAVVIAAVIITTEVITTIVIVYEQARQIDSIKKMMIMGHKPIRKSMMKHRETAPNVKELLPEFNKESDTNGLNFEEFFPLARKYFPEAAATEKGAKVLFNCFDRLGDYAQLEKKELQNMIDDIYRHGGKLYASCKSVSDSLFDISDEIEGIATKADEASEIPTAESLLTEFNKDDDTQQLSFKEFYPAAAKHFPDAASTEEDAHVLFNCFDQLGDYAQLEKKELENVINDFYKNKEKLYSSCKSVSDSLFGIFDEIEQIATAAD